MEMSCLFSKPSYENILHMQKIIVENNDFDACCVYNLTELRRSK